MQLNTNLYYVGIQDFDLRVFDIIMETKFGTSYNSYLLKTEAGNVLFETAKAKFFDEYLENIKAYTTLDQIKYVVCSHTDLIMSAPWKDCWNFVLRSQLFPARWQLTI